MAKFEDTYNILRQYGLDEVTIQSIEQGEVQWDIVDNNLMLFHNEGGHRYKGTLSDDQIDSLFNAYRFELRACQTDNQSPVFQPGTIDDWTGVAPNTDWAQYVSNFKEAALALGERHSNEFAEPFLFLCRHTFELMLKAIVMLGQEYLDLDHDLPSHHDLSRLWSAAYPMMLLTKKAEGEGLLRARKVVEEYQRVDPSSTTFRYPVDKNNSKMKAKDGLVRFSRSQHAKAFKESAEALNRTIDSLKMMIVLKGLNEKWKEAQQGAAPDASGAGEL